MKLLSIVVVLLMLFPTVSAGQEKQRYANKEGDDWRVSAHEAFEQLDKAAANAELTFRVHARTKNKLLVLMSDHVAEVEVLGSADWQDVRLSLKDFKNFENESLSDWEGIKTLKFTDAIRLKGKQKGQRRRVGKRWQGDGPVFNLLKWSVPEETENVSALTPNKKIDDQSSQMILDVFPESTVRVATSKQGATSLTSKFTPSPSVWAKGLREQAVFQAELTHQQDPNNSYSLRIGKGGQVYSLRGPFGESVPPSFRKEDSPRQSPWNDEVWQFVAVCGKYNGTKKLEKLDDFPAESLKLIKASPFKNSYFVHNSGAYIANSLEIKSLYCPMLASQADQDARSYRILNWGLVPQIKSIHRSPILYYTQVRDAGDGVIELTWVVHNFGIRADAVFDHLNAPWGGTRISNLPYRYVASPDGKLLERKEILSEIGCADFRNTMGFNLSCATEEDDCPALALVFGRDKHLADQQKKKAAGEDYWQTSKSIYRDWRAREPAYKNEWKDWSTRSVNSFRNYDVCEVIPKIKLAPATSIWFRSYLVVGAKKDVVEKAKKLVDHVDYGVMNYRPDETPMLPVSSSEMKDGAFRVFSRPVAGTMPLFSIQNTSTKQQIVTTDPYYFVKQEQLDFKIPPRRPEWAYYANARGYSLDQHNSNWQSLVGYGYKDKPVEGNWKQISTLMGEAEFPAATEHHLDLWVQVP